MVLCFGVMGKIIKLCCAGSVTNRDVVNGLITTVDPESRYDDHTAAYRLLNCETNLSRKSDEQKKEESENRTRSKDRLTDIPKMALTVDSSEVVMKMQSQIIPLLNPDKKEQLVSALFEVIATDISIVGERRESFRKYAGFSAERVRYQRTVHLAEMLTGLLLYTAACVDNKEGIQSAKLINEEYLAATWRKHPGVDVYLSLSEEYKEQSKRNDFVFREEEEERIRTYLKRGIEKYSRIRILISGDQLVNFDDIYICNMLDTDEPGKFKQIEDVTAEELKQYNQCTVICGTGGLGKSMMMRHMFLHSAKHYRGNEIIPVYIQARDYPDDTIPFEDYVFSKFEIFGTGFTMEDFTRLLREGRFLFLFDGLDEIRLKDVQRFGTELIRFSDKYHNNQFIASSRPNKSYYPMETFRILNLHPFTKEQATELIEKLNFRPDEPGIKEKFLQRLKDEFYDTHYEFASNPLLLTIMLMTFEEYADIPSGMHIFYREAFTALARKHDANKGAYIRYMRTGLSVERIESYIAEFCALSYIDEKYSFTEDEFTSFFYRLKARTKYAGEAVEANHFLYDLRANLCLLYYEEGKFHFIHRSFQEYFCALYFSRQNDSILYRICEPMAEKRFLFKRDRMLDMLYGMIPEKMETFVFLPVLTKLFADSTIGDGYWRFLEEIYPELRYKEGTMNIHIFNHPSSGLYSFIRSIVFNEDIDDLDLPYVIDFVEAEYAYKKNDESRGLVDVMSMPDSIRQHYGTLKIVGREMRFEIKKVLKSRKQYQEFLSALDDSHFVLRREYEAMGAYYEKLEERQRPIEDNWFDLLI